MQHIMKKHFSKIPSILISAGGLIVLGALFANWWISSSYALSGRISAIISAVLFAAVCLRFVPAWMKFWAQPAEANSLADRQTPRHMDLKIFVTLMLMNAAILGAVWLIRRILGYSEGFLQGLEFWRCLDSNSYLEISKEWYVSEGDRSVQLAFLPGYPIVVRLFTFLTGYELYAGILVSMLSFACAGCLFYRLMRLDHSHRFAVRALKYLCILPGTFFYAAPMTESLFLLLCVGCIYFARTGKWTLGCLLGCYAAFTRSLGATLLAPMVIELVHMRGSRKEIVRRSVSLLLIPLGLIAYFCINYIVAGDPFKFQEIQSTHWSQHLGMFFNTAAYQLRQFVGSMVDRPNVAAGLWGANLLSCFGSLALMLAAAKKLRPCYTAWFIGYFFMAIGATWLLSAPRYLLTLFPISIAMALLTCCTIALNLIYLYAFVARWQVW